MSARPDGDSSIFKQERRKSNYLYRKALAYDCSFAGRSLILPFSFYEVGEYYFLLPTKSGGKERKCNACVLQLWERKLKDNFRRHLVVSISAHRKESCRSFPRRFHLPLEKWLLRGEISILDQAISFLVVTFRRRIRARWPKYVRRPNSIIVTWASFLGQFLAQRKIALNATEFDRHSNVIKSKSGSLLLEDIIVHLLCSKLRFNRVMLWASLTCTKIASYRGQYVRQFRNFDDEIEVSRGEKSN